MPENHLDTPATKVQADAYAADPTDPLGKPYSSKQKKSNAENLGRFMMYHREEGTRVFNPGDEVPEGWQDSPFVNHNDGDKPIGEPEVPEVPATIDVNILREECAKRNIEYDKRWGKQKLMEALENGNS